MKKAEEKLLGDKSRRRFFRHACDASVTGAFDYDRKDKWSSNIHSGYLKSDSIGQSRLRVLNVSKGGAALVSQYPVVKGTVLSLTISTAFNTTIRAQARVKWSKQLKTSTEIYAIGLKFLKMSRGDTRNLKELLKVLDKSSSEERVPSE